MNSSSTPIQATTPQLLKGTVLAAVAACAILIVAVLPAEYGYDPTGIGEAIGLTALANHGDAAEAEVQLPATDTTAGATVVQYEVPFHSDEKTLTLQPNEGAEIKAVMRTGESFVFGWTTDGGPVSFDMHGEKLNASDEFSSYWKDRDQISAHGRFVAPFDGTHGWYWKNRGTVPVTITVKVAGYFEKLYMPG